MRAMFYVVAVVSVLTLVGAYQRERTRSVEAEAALVRANAEVSRLDALASTARADRGRADAEVRRLTECPATLDNGRATCVPLSVLITQYNASTTPRPAAAAAAPTLDASMLAQAAACLGGDSLSCLAVVGRIAPGLAAR